MDIIVTMPKNRGGLTHLQEKIDFTQKDDGYAWWWVKQANMLHSNDYVHIVCDGRLRGCFSIKWVIDLVEKNEYTTHLKIRFRTSYGTLVLDSPDGVFSTIKQAFQRFDSSIIWIDPEESLSTDDIHILLDFEEWYREGMQTIFFNDWYPNLEQPEMKGFQGFQYFGGTK